MRTTHIQPGSLFGLICLCLLVIVGASSIPPNPLASPSADTELICPTEYAGDCYPRIFQPTEEFQLIKEGQDLPPGLHVRLNIYTGEKEARLNIPMDGEDNLSLEDVPVEQAMVIVEQPEPENQEPIQPSIPPNAPPYDAAGKIQPPPPNSGDAVAFNAAKVTINTDGQNFDNSLDDLSELAHDIYYGVEIARDRLTVEKLLCLALGSGSEKFPATENIRDRKAASILASAIQNNPTALEEVAKMGKLVTFPSCGSGAGDDMAIGLKSFVGILRHRLESEKEPLALRAKVTLVSSLMKEPGIRDNFVQEGVMDLLLAMWVKDGEQWDAVRIKVAQLVMDNFLDENMGAELGVWPKKPVSQSKICESKDRMLEDGCWEYHIESFLKSSPAASWAKDFLKTLQKQRAKVVEPISHIEL